MIPKDLLYNSLCFNNVMQIEVMLFVSLFHFLLLLLLLNIQSIACIPGKKSNIKIMWELGGLFNSTTHLRENASENKKGKKRLDFPLPPWFKYP